MRTATTTRTATHPIAKRASVKPCLEVGCLGCKDCTGCCAALLDMLTLPDIILARA